MSNNNTCPRHWTLIKTLVEPNRLTIEPNKETNSGESVDHWGPNHGPCAGTSADQWVQMDDRHGEEEDKTCSIKALR
jgi:hypothetical protein